VAVRVDEVGGDGTRATAIVVDCCCLCERDSLVRALDEDSDGGCAGAAAKFFVFAGELVPVVSFGCGRDGLVSVLAWLESRPVWMDGCTDGLTVLELEFFRHVA
jgi:hypothetical protein